MMTKVEPFSHLLRVFYWGLINGVVSRADVIAWADYVIAAEDEPDYFFIEISLSPTVDDLMTVINSEISVDLDVVSTRAILGLLYNEFTEGRNSIGEAVDKLQPFAHNPVLSWYEISSIYMLDEYEYLPADGIYEQGLQDELEAFLSVYADFKLENYNDWLSINAKIESDLAYELSKAAEERAESLQAEKQRMVSIDKRYARLAYGLGILSTLIIAAKLTFVDDADTLTKFQADLYTFSLLVFLIFVGYHIAWVFNWIAVKMFKKY